RSEATAAGSVRWVSSSFPPTAVNSRISSLSTPSAFPSADAITGVPSSTESWATPCRSSTSMDRIWNAQIWTPASWAAARTASAAAPSISRVPPGAPPSTTSSAAGPRRPQAARRSGGAASGAAAELRASFISGLGDLDPPYLRTFLEILPPEPVRPFRLELVAQREGVVVVDQHERFARIERVEGAEDGRVLLPRRDQAYVELHRFLVGIGHAVTPLRD